MDKFEAMAVIRFNRSGYKATQDKYVFAKEVWGEISESPLNVLTIDEVEQLLDVE
jgi:hypothetical protein